MIKRQVQIIKGIYDNPTANLKELSEILGVSLQTIKADLQNMDGLLNEYGIELDFLTGNRLRIRGAENLICLLKDAETMLEFSMEKQIILLLLLHDDYLVLQDIADMLYVSKSLVEKIMPVLLKKYPEELKSVRHYGVRYVASQLERRSKFVEILAPYFQGIDFKAEFYNFDRLHFTISSFITEHDIEQSIAAVHYVHSIKKFSFTDESICQLFLHALCLKASHRRFKKVHMGTMFAELVHGMEGEQEFNAAAGELGRILDTTAEDEQFYLTYLLMTLRKQQMSDNEYFVVAMESIIKEIFKRIFDRMSINFNDDKDLINGLSVHLYTTILRKDHLKTSSLDYQWQDVRYQYPLGYEMAAVAAEVILSEIKYKVSEEEMLYLAMHFQAAVERMKNGRQKIKVIIVCHYGMAAASLISSKLKRLLVNIEVVEITSMQAFLRKKVIEANLVLSTETVKKIAAPIIYVTPLLLENEIKQIRDFINRRCISNILMVYILNSNVINMTDVSSKEMVLAQACQYLHDAGCVNEHYLDSVQSREDISSTDVGIIAIPHGNPDFVSQSKLVIIRLDKPVRWEVSEVQYIFLFAVSREQFNEQLSLFTTFYKRLARADVRNEIKKIGRQAELEFKNNLAHLLTGDK